MSAECCCRQKKEEILAERMLNLPKTFIAEILGVALKPGMISFAGGLPNKDLFPIDELAAATDKVMRSEAKEAFQYSGSAGYPGLRELIAARYAARGIQNVKAENILITTGSQQAFDMLGKVLVNEGDRVLLEEPSYLGAIGALALFKPRFVTVPLNENGLDVAALAEALKDRVKMMYLIPNFQNPSGISYEDDNRRAVADVVRQTGTFLVEDDPYGELRFEGAAKTSFMNLIPEQTILLGTFSKTIVPGYRVGWMVVPEQLREALLVVKESADLHTSTFAQRVLTHYMADNDQDAHIAKIKAKYKKQKDDMMGFIQTYFPSTVTHTKPEGGMFLWVTLPGGADAMEFFHRGVERSVCVVPGHPFYVNKASVSSMRFSFSTVDYNTMEEGIKRLGALAHEMVG